MTGTEFGERIARLSGVARELAILSAVDRGDFPSPEMIPIKLKRGALEGSLSVAADYFSIGTRDDFIRMPMWPQTAQKIADILGGHLPTARVVDIVHHEARIHIEPITLTGDRESSSAFTRHSRLIDAALTRKSPGGSHAEILDGLKKDIVITKEMEARPGKVAIYGWYRLSGERWQNLSLVHDEHYLDYSHGVRYMKASMNCGGADIRVSELLSDPHLCALLSDEGPLSAASFRYP